ncbi:MAG: ComEC/Rec2 family competence protein [Parvibaculum sp.]
MAIFWEKSGASPPGQRFRRQMDRLVLLVLAFWAGLNAAIVPRISVEQSRIGLWAPVAMAAGIALYFAWPVEPAGRWSLIALGTAIFIAYRLRSSNWLALVSLGLVAGAFGFNAALLRTTLVDAPSLAREMRGVSLEGRVIEANTDESGGLVLIVEPSHIDRLSAAELPARLRLKVKQKQAMLWPGDHITTRVLLWPPSEPVAPGAFDFARQAFFQRLGGTGVTLSLPIVVSRGERASASLWLEQTRETITRHIISSLGPETGPVAAALMTGQRRAIPDETVQHLRDSGLAHILAISGLHMVLFAGTLFWLLRAGLALVPRLALHAPIKKWAAFAALFGALAYLLLSGSAVATQRAFIMTALMFLAVLLDRPAFSLRNVALAAMIVLTLRPESLLEPGFQMSFAAVTGLVAVYQNRELQLLRLKEKSTGFRGLINMGIVYVATLALTSLVAGAATAPYAAFHFNRMATFGLVGNLLAMPLVGAVIMPAALIAYILMPFGLDGPALWVMGWGLEGVLWAAELVAGWDGAAVGVPAMSDASLVTITLGGLWLALWRTRLRLAGIPLIALGLLMAANFQQPDILISAEGKLIAVRGVDGNYTWSGRAPRYAAETWGRRNGEAASATPRANPMTCDLLGCVATTVDKRVVIALKPEALEDDCARAEILIAQFPVRGQSRTSCAASLIIDIFDMSRHGAHAIYLEEDHTARISTVAELRGARPWSSH